MHAPASGSPQEGGGQEVGGGRPQRPHGRHSVGGVHHVGQEEEWESHGAHLDRLRVGVEGERGFYREEGVEMGTGWMLVGRGCLNRVKSNRKVCICCI